MKPPLKIFLQEKPFTYDSISDLTSKELVKLKWWNDVKPSQLKSRFRDT